LLAAAALEVLQIPLATMLVVVVVLEEFFIRPSMGILILTLAHIMLLSVLEELEVEALLEAAVLNPCLQILQPFGEVVVGVQTAQFLKVVLAAAVE
jgi:hypothetical protein